MTVRPAVSEPAAAPESWKARIAQDRERATRHQSAPQREVTEEVLRRSLADGARAVALTGSIARGHRTEISDLDYHVVGRRPAFDDLPAEVDIYAGDVAHFWAKLRSGDDFVQWTLRFGCVLFDTGVFQAAWAAMHTERLWPDGDAKLRRLPEHREAARRLIEMGDRDAAQDEVRAALTTAARGLLLEADVFPLARSELPGQVEILGNARLAKALSGTIHAQRSLRQLDDDLGAIDSLLRRVGGLATSPGS